MGTARARFGRRVPAAALAANLVLLTVVGGGDVRAERRGSVPPPSVYIDRHRCGVVDMTLLAPRVYVAADLDGDGSAEHFFATWGGVERHRLQPGSVPQSTVMEEIVYSSSVGEQYTCVDLQARDVDRDGDLDLVFASTRELVVLENGGGSLRVARVEPLALPRTADVRIGSRDGALSAYDQSASP